eukprot:6203422-Pleurochrysis_carterae.AAC.1
MRVLTRRSDGNGVKVAEHAWSCGSAQSRWATDQARTERCAALADVSARACAPSVRCSVCEQGIAASRR